MPAHCQIIKADNCEEVLILSFLWETRSFSLVIYQDQGKKALQEGLKISKLHHVAAKARTGATELNHRGIWYGQNSQGSVTVSVKWKKCCSHFHACIITVDNWKEQHIWAPRNRDFIWSTPQWPDCERRRGWCTKVATKTDNGLSAKYI